MPSSVKSISLIFGLILVGLLSSLIYTAEAQEPVKRRALLIGMKDYKQTVGPLQNTHKDVRVMADALSAAGFEVELLLDDVPNGVTISRSKILSKLRSHAQAVANTPDAISFVYYSGHGAANEEDNRNYIIPQNVESIATAELWDESLKLEDAIDRLTNNAPAAAHFVVFDACRNELKLPTESRNLSKGFVAEQAPGGVFLAFSTAEGQVAQDGGAEDVAGPFAKALSEQITVGGQNHVTMFLRAAQQVKQRIGQTPYIETGLLQEIYLNGSTPTAPTQPIASDDTATARTPEPLLSQRKALIISNSSYLAPFTPLEEAHATGKRVSEAMQVSGFEVTHLQDPDRTQLLTEATRMLTSFEGNAFEKLAVIHYIGHVKGLSDRVNRGLSEGGTNYLIPTGIPIRSSFELPIHAVELGKLIDLASAQTGVSSVFIVDGCRQDGLVSISSTENCVTEAERENVMITINTIEPSEETPDPEETGPPEPVQSYSDRFAEELIIGGDLSDVIEQTNTKQAVAVGKLSTQTSGAIDKSYQLTPVTAPLQTVSLGPLIRAKTACYDAVQNKLAWDAAGTQTRWIDANVNALCEGQESSVQPARCFEGYMQYVRDRGLSPRWSNASALCVGAVSSEQTLSCFESALQSTAGLKVSEAISVCKAED